MDPDSRTGSELISLKIPLSGETSTDLDNDGSLGSSDVLEALDVVDANDG